MNTRQRAALLRETELFHQLDEEALLKLADRTVTRVFDKGQTIFVQEERGDRMFVIMDGVVKLLVRSRSGEFIELIRHSRATVFGELAVLDNGPRSASAEAVERTTLLSLARDDLFEVLHSRPDVVEALLRWLVQIVRRTTKDLADLAFLDLEGRVARRILALAQGAGPASVGTTIKGRRITQTEIAQMVSGTRQTVNRALRSLERRGLIVLSDGTITIKNRDGLQRRADR
jgi:CRP/FNR family transcriptional regulator, cyclic AMP receptor protein